MTHLFLSDVHIGRHAPQKEHHIRHALQGLLQYAEKQDVQIHILGDLFDYWMEYPGWQPKLGADTLNAFASYHATTGRHTTYITGNHDNWTRGHFATLGFDLQSEYKIIDLDGLRVFMHHGDGLANPQFQYPRPLFHRIIRHPLFVAIYQGLLPPRFGLGLMRWFSARKGKRLQVKPQGLSSWSESFLQSSAEQDGAIDGSMGIDGSMSINGSMGIDGRRRMDVVMNGHVHRAVRKKVESGLILQLPAFFDGFRLLKYTNGSFSFVRWDEEQQCLRTAESVKSLHSTNQPSAKPGRHHSHRLDAQV